MFWRLEELDEALVTGGRALEIAGRLGDVRLRILTTSFLGQTHYYRGEYERAVGLAIDNLAALSTQHASTIAAAHLAAGTLHLLKGDWARARSLIEHEIPFAVAASAWVLAQLGETGEALNRLREGNQLFERIAADGRIAHRTWVYQSLGRASLLLGQLGEARCRADRAVEKRPRRLADARVLSVNYCRRSGTGTNSAAVNGPRKLPPGSACWGLSPLPLVSQSAAQGSSP